MASARLARNGCQRLRRGPGFVQFLHPIPPRRPPETPEMTKVATAAALLLAFGWQSGPPQPRAVPTVPPSAFQALRWRFVGPFRAGWATVAEGVPSEPNTFYFGAAGGGVWKTTDAGRTWQGLMQHEASSAIGALAVAPSDPNVLYVGTGQVAARYDIAAGDGIYRSNDAGRTWTNVGLGATHHIGRILVDPHDPNQVLVAAMGHVFGPNPERGVYRTTDGGQHWQQVLHVDDNTGAVDLAWDPANPSVVYAAMWQMRMHPWMDYFMPQSGPGSGIYKSSDGGVHWERVANGLPTADIGRIGLAVAPGSRGAVVYASVALEGSALTTAPLTRGKSGLYRSDDAGTNWRLVNDDPALASSYFGRVTVAPDDPNTVYVTGQSIRRSTDGGKTFGFFKGAPGGDDYHFLWIDPTNASHMIEGADQGAAVTVNGGKSWSSWYNQPTGQLYHLAVDDRFPYRIYSGQQDNGTVELWSRGPYGVVDERDWHPVGGDERDYMVPKPGAPDTVFGTGLGGHMSRFDEVTRQSGEVSPWPVSTYGAYPVGLKYRYTWITPMAFAPQPPHTMYLGAQVLFSSTDDGDHWKVISPDLSGRKSGATADCHDATAAQARDCGFGVIFAIAPSPVSKNVIWVGTDDGLIQRTADGGAHWTNVTPPDVPAWARIDNIDASPFDANAAYASVDMHRLDRDTPLVLRTTDGGKHWQTITSGIPADEFVMVVRADPVKRGLLFAGTNRTVYVSFDDGAAWQPLSLNLPTTWYRDLLVHDGDLITATQGRGIWILDDIEPLREAATAAASPTHLFAPLVATRLRGDENRDTPWPPSTPVAENPPTGAVIDYWLASASAGPVTLTIRDATGRVVRTFSSADEPEKLPVSQYFENGWLGSGSSVSAEAGMHRFVWDLRYPRPDALSYDYSIAGVWHRGTPVDPRGPLALPGRYTVSLSAGGKAYTQPLAVRMDPRVHVPPSALRAQFALAMEVDATLGRATAAHRAVSAYLEAHAGTMSKAGADAAHAIAGGIESVDGVLTSLATAVVAADAEPTQGERAVLAEYSRQLDALVARWKQLAGATGGR
jgi:photosystem II stability/assembly factor-like uncharacterized protein